MTELISIGLMVEWLWSNGFVRIDFKECYFVSTSVLSFPTLCEVSYFYASESLTVRLIFILASVKSDNFVHVGESLALGISQW